VKSFYKAAALAIGAAWAFSSGAQDVYPSKPIKLVVPFASGSATDIVARAVSEPLSKRLNVPIVVENREGAGGVIGTNSVIKAAPDGYTLLLTSNPLTIAPYMHKQQPFDPAADLQPVTQVVSMPLAIVISAQSPIKTLPELIEYIRANPGKTNFASIGIGSQSHLQGEWLRNTYNLNTVHVSYKSGNSAAIDTSTGLVTFFVPTYAASVALIDAGKLKALAIGTPKRTAAAPDVPTFAEALGRKDVQLSAWFGFLAPRNIPSPVLAKLNEEIVKTMASPEVAGKLSGLKADVNVAPTAEFREHIKAESERWRALLDKLGLRNQE
jgi:tripartite-type tricarboxylate transporter receptor subunit TctC